MMRLRFAPLSPYVRKVRVVAHELGIADTIELVPTQLRVDDPPFWAANPLAKIPVLTLADGTSYFDSVVICEYLDATYGQHRLVPVSGPARWRALTTIALADGMTEAGMIARQENLKPRETRSAGQVNLQLAKVQRGLDRLQEDVRDAAGKFLLPQITAACSIGWLVLRFGSEEILSGRSALKRWYDGVSARPSMIATAPLESA
jgi:glutathione S-transferase